MPWSEFITVAPRYTRSINLERDASDAANLNGYVITVTGVSMLERIAASLIEGSLFHRAWTLTGPYGSGKSAFALYAASLLGSPQQSTAKRARQLLKEQIPSFYSALFSSGARRIVRMGFCSVLVTGAPESLLGALLTAAYRDLRPYYSGLPGRVPAAYKNIESLRDAFQQGRAITGTEVVQALVTVAEHLKESGRADGIILVVDELGKFLEHAARFPEQGDIYVLQQLAEASARMPSAALLLLTVLHQSFERYAANLRPSVREEWAKVQGRFEDVAFQEPPEQFLTLLSSAIEHKNDPFTKKLEQHAGVLAKQAGSLGLALRGVPEKDFLHSLVRCAPLHPLTALVLPRLCRKFGQNQRSLFSFLVSREPFGFGEFLQQETNPDDLRFYGLADLYDYIANAFGSGLSLGEAASRWAEVQASLDRLGPAASENEVRFIKTVGLLSAVGTYGGLKATEEIIRFALEDPRSFSRTYQSLLSQSLLVKRRHNGTVALWEGSDLDLEQRLREAAIQLPDTVSLAEKLSTLWASRPMIAKRHSYQTGTLRYFSVAFADIASFSKQRTREADEDGLLLYCTPNTPRELEELRELAQHSEAREQMELLIAVPQEVAPLQEAIRDLELLRWVQSHTPELQSDAVARRELRTRLTVAEARVSEELRRLFSPSQRTSHSTLWFHRGLQRSLAHARSLANLLSDICDQVYGQTPILRNELINRRQLSSAAAKARRNLLEAMIERSGEARLGFTGTPPEISIYCSVLEKTGIHRPVDELWDFHEPTDPSLLPVWKAIESFFDACEEERRSVSELFGQLQNRPFGLKLGVTPLLFCAAALSHDTDLAFYEGSIFLPELTTEAMERLVRAPERFQIRRYRIEGVRREVFRHMAKLFGAVGTTEQEDIVAIMRPLYRFLHRLPAFSRQTKFLSPVALALREALLAAKEPDVLLFSDLPQACGLEPLTATATIEPERLEQFLRQIRTALAELQRAYDALLNSLTSTLLHAFHVEERNARALLRSRAAVLLSHCVEARLKAFLAHLSEGEMSDSSWIEAIGTLLVGKAPPSWNDSDRVRFEVNLTDMVRAFRHLESLVFEQTRRLTSGETAEQVLRIGVSDRHSKDLEAVVIIETKDRGRLAEAVLQIRDRLESLSLHQDPELALAALGMVSQELLAQLGKVDSSAHSNMKRMALEQKA